MALIAVMGANGVQGMAQMRQAKAAGHDLRAISRHRSDRLHALFPDAGFHTADLMDEASLVPALAGVDYLLVNLAVPMRQKSAEILAGIGRAALAAGVRRLVYNTATWIPERPGDPFVYGVNTRMVNALFRTGMPATVFGSVLYMDNLQTSWAKHHIVNENRFHYPHSPEMRANWISLDDVGKVMVHALDRPDLEGAWMNIGGPERLSPQQVCAILSAAAGREIRYDPASPEQFGEMLAGGLGSGMTESERQAFNSYMREFYHYNNTAPTRPFEVDFEHVQRRLPIRFETMAEWAARQDWRPGSPGS